MALSVTVIIGAGGTGARMGKNKQLMMLLGKPVVARTLEVFQNHPLITSIVLVRPKDLAKDFKALVKAYGISKVTAEADSSPIARQASIYNGLQKAPKCDVILIHNGANPLVTDQEITDCINAAQEHGAAVVAHPVKDTIKEVDKDGFVINTLNRDSLRAMQTPQGMRYDVAMESYDYIMKNNIDCTDDVQAAELRFGKKIRIKTVLASPQNIKLTTPADITFAEAFLNKQED